MQYINYILLECHVNQKVFDMTLNTDYMSEWIVFYSNNDIRSMNVYVSLYEYNFAT